MPTTIFFCALGERERERRKEKLSSILLQLRSVLFLAEWAACTFRAPIPLSTFVTHSRVSNSLCESVVRVCAPAGPGLGQPIEGHRSGKAGVGEWMDAAGAINILLLLSKGYLLAPPHSYATLINLEPKALQIDFFFFFVRCSCAEHRLHFGTDLGQTFPTCSHTG